MLKLIIEWMAVIGTAFSVETVNSIAFQHQRKIEFAAGLIGVDLNKNISIDEEPQLYGIVRAIHFYQVESSGLCSGSCFC